jgi:hypothetical protein
MKERRVRVVHVIVDEENQAEEFWTALRQRSEFKRLVDVLEALNEAYVTMRLAKKFHAVCQTLPGWNSGPGYTRRPLVFLGLNGR